MFNRRIIYMVSTKTELNVLYIKYIGDFNG